MGRDTNFCIFSFSLLMMYISVTGIPSSVYGQTWWEYQSRDDAVWTEVTESTGVLWLVKGINDVGDPNVPGGLTQCQDPLIPLETEWVLRTTKITFANESYAGIKPCGQDVIGWLAVVESDDYVTTGFKPQAFHFGDADFLKCGYNAILCVDVHIVDTKDDLPEPLPPWYPPTNIPEVVFASTSGSVVEDAGTHNVAVNLSPAAPAGGVTLDYTIGGSATGGSDYTSLSGTVDVTAGATSVNIPVVITDDNDDETDETIVLTLTSGTGYTVGSADTHTLTITDNDTPATPEIAFASASGSVDEDAGTHNVIVNIVPAPQADLALSYDLGGTAVEGEDYSISGSGTVAVTAGETSVNIPVVIIDDSDEEESKTIILTLTSGAGYDVGSADTHTLTITDNDTPEIVFASASGSVDEDAGTHNVIVNIVPAPQADLALSYDLGGTAVKGEDYSISGSGTAAVTAGETSVNIPVMITDDNEDEENETIILTLTGGAGYEVGSVNTHTLTITDNDTTPEAAFYSASASVAEDAGVHNVAVRIRPAPESDLTLTYGLEGTAKEEADYSITNSGTISVAAGVDSVNIAILIADDSEDESDETVILTLTGGAGYSVGSVKVYTLMITDNDATVTLSVTPNPVSEGEEVTVMATLSEAASSEISIPLVLTAGTAEEGDYGALSAIVIDKDERSGTGMIVTSLDSDLDDETFTITFGTLPAGIVAGTQASVEVKITDAGERTSIESRGEEIPSEFSLAQNYPNPFNPSTAIEFSLTRTGQVTLTVYDMLGQKVRTLLEGVRPAGRHSVLFDGVGLASDTYIYVLQTEQHRAVKMMTLLK